MFGLDGSKKKKPEFEFELEKELSSVSTHNVIKKKIEDRIEQVKKILRGGENKKDFERYGLVLHGYTSLLKVMSRFNPK